MFALDRIRSGTRNTKLVPWPGTNEMVRLRILSKAETQDAAFQAHAHFTRADVPPDKVHTIEDYEDEKTVQMLYRALSGTEAEEDGKPLSRSIEIFRTKVCRDEISTLAQHYSAFEREVSPNPEHMDEETYREFVDALKKKPDETIEFVSSIALAKRLLRSLASPSST